MSEDKLAVLIDADNISHKHLEDVLAEISSFGTSFVKRAYGDWTNDSLKNWKEKLLNNSVRSVQQHAYSKGKNSTDAAMIIDAMDLLYTKRFDAFCLVSSDSDFTRLASRIREEGLKVYGFGKRSASKPFVKAFDKFVFIDIFEKKEENTEKKSIESLRSLKKHITQALNNLTKHENEWVMLSPLQQEIVKLLPSFDHRNYDCSKLSQLMEKLNYLEVKKTPLKNGSNCMQISVRLKH